MYRKTSADLSEEYKFDENIIVSNPTINKKKNKKNINKLADEDFFIPEFKQYTVVSILNYNVKQLKEICKHYKLKQSGNKNEVKNRIIWHLKHTYYILKIQKIFKSCLFKKYLRLRGSAIYDKTCCVNESDFVSLKNLKDINHYSFFSYTNNNITYGFHVGSLKTYIDNDNKSKKELINPYDRSIIPNDIINNFYSYIKLSKLFNYPIELEGEKDDVVLNESEIIKNKAVELFQHMDSLGNYTNPNWFLNLDIRRLIKYIRELHDIWEYRAQLSNETKRNIHYPNGTPFMHNLGTSRDITHLQKVVLVIIENLTTKGSNNEYKSLGIMYVLGGFTLVSQDAAEALPWLYESVVHI